MHDDDGDNYGALAGWEVPPGAGNGFLTFGMRQDGNEGMKA
jgi:hypothetical protein